MCKNISHGSLRKSGWKRQYQRYQVPWMPMNEVLSKLTKLQRRWELNNSACSRYCLVLVIVTYCLLVQSYLFLSTQICDIVVICNLFLVQWSSVVIYLAFYFKQYLPWYNTFFLSYNFYLWILCSWKYTNCHSIYSFYFSYKYWTDSTQQQPFLKGWFVFKRVLKFTPFF